jgi:hypothetical protein
MGNRGINMKEYKSKIIALKYAKNHNKQVIRSYTLEKNKLNKLVRIYKYKVI